MKKTIAILATMLSMFWLVACSSGGSGVETVDSGNTDNTMSSEFAKTAITIDLSGASSASPVRAVYTHYDVLEAIKNSAKTINITMTSPTDVYSKTVNVLVGTVTKVYISDVRVGTYTLAVSILTANKIELFTSTSIVEIKGGDTNKITPRLVVSPSFTTTITITGFPVGVTGVYPMTVTQILASGTPVANTSVTGSYDSVSGAMVFTLPIYLWPELTTELSYAVPTFSVPVDGDPLVFNVLDILIASAPSMSSAYQSLVTPMVEIGLPILADMGMDLSTTAGFWASSPFESRATRTAGTGMINVLIPGNSWDVILTVPTNTVAGVDIPFTFACSGNTNPVEIHLVRNVIPYETFTETPIVTACGNPNPALPFILKPNQTGLAQLQLRFPEVGNYTIYNMSL